MNSTILNSPVRNGVIDGNDGSILQVLVGSNKRFDNDGPSLPGDKEQNSSRNVGDQD